LFVQSAKLVTPRTEKSINVLTQASAAIWVSQFAQRFRFNLPDSLSGDAKELTDFFQSALPSIIQTEAQAQHITLSW
jgi:hypothetical protein